MDEIHWWSERLDAWSHEGFNVDAFRDALAGRTGSASELLMQFDDLVSKEQSLEAKSDRFNHASRGKRGAG